MQIWVLIEYLDLSCSLMQHNPQQADAKRQAMQQLTDEVLKSGSFKGDGSFAVPIGGQAGSLTDATNGVFRRTKDGKDCLVFHWLNERDLYVLSYLLSGIAAQLRNTLDEKAQSYLAEGLKMLEGMKYPFHGNRLYS